MTLSRMEHHVHHVWIALLLLHSTAVIQSVRFYIVASPNSPCPGEFNGDPCITLAQYIRLINSQTDPVISRDVILDLQPGTHRTETQFSLSGIKSLTMTGSNVSFICGDNRWRRRPFILTSIANVQISGINFTDCQGSEITSVDDLVIQDCSFQTSSLTLQNVNATVVQTSFDQSLRSRDRVFASNQPRRNRALTLIRTSMQLKRCYFTNNNIGVISALESFPPSNLTVTSCIFTNNRFQDGAIFFETDGIVTIKNSKFTRNNPTSVYLDGIRSLFISDTTFDGGNRGTHQAVQVANPRGSVVFLRSSFIRHSGFDDGGAVSIRGGRSTNFTECDFRNNTASLRGGAVYTSGSDHLISVKGGAFVNNQVILGGGGALYSQGQRTNFSFVDVLFHNNSATFCGALEVEGLFHESVNFKHSSFVGNRATGRLAQNSANFYRGGGAICIRNASISVINSTFNGNSAVENAGVMHIEESSVEIVDSKFDHNEATLDGGVIYTKLLPNTFTIHHSSFSDNEAGDDGGVMYMGRTGSHIDVNKSNFSLNHATDRGGVFVILGSILNIAETNFNDNTASQGNDISECISEVNADNMFETITSNRTACISYNANRPILTTEPSTVAIQTEETVTTTRSMVRRTVGIIMPLQTIDPLTTAITPNDIMEETTTDAPSTTVASKTESETINTSTMAETDLVGTTTSQTEPLETTTDFPLELSTTTLEAEESTTTVAVDASTTSDTTINSTIPRSTEASSTVTDTMAISTTGFQTEASTTVMLPGTEEAAHITTLSQTEDTTNTNMQVSSTTTTATAQTDHTTASVIETSTNKDTVISPTEATSTLTDLRITTAANEDATEKLPSSTGSGGLLPTTDSLKGDNNAGGTILGSVGILTICSAFILISI